MYAPYVERLILDGARSKLTRAALETLAVVAYLQPISRSRVSGIRGVNVDSAALGDYAVSGVSPVSTYVNDTPLFRLPLLALGREAWLVNPTHRRLQQARARLPHLRVKTWRL